MGGSPVWDGTLSLDSFNTSAAALVKRWKEIEVDDSLPEWTWKPCSKSRVPLEVEGYLALERVYSSCGRSQEQIEEMEKFDDAGDVAWVESSSDNVHVYDFHVVYSFSYKVPVLYFRGYHTSGQLLTLDEVKEGLPSHSQKVLSESKWTFITQEEHPHLSKPWLTLHPCATSDWMKLLLEETKATDKERSLQYLPAWLSVVGQAVGLKIPLELHSNS